MGDRLLDLVLWLLANNLAAMSLLLRIFVGPSTQSRLDATLGVHLRQVGRTQFYLKLQSSGGSNVL